MIARARETALVLALLLICTPAAAEVLTMTLDNVSVNTCDTDWAEGSCVMRVVETAEGDQVPPGSCVWDQLGEGVALLGARLEVDTTALTGVEEVQIDLRESSGDGHTKVYLYDTGANVIQFMLSFHSGSPTDQTLPIFIPGSELGKIVISGADVLIQEIRLVGNLLVDAEASSWSAIKSRW